MIKEYLEMYILKMESIKITMDVLDENMQSRIKKEMNKYKDAILMAIYFDDLLDKREDKKLEKHVQRYITVNDISEEDRMISYKFNRAGDQLNKQKSIKEAIKIISIGFNTLSTMYNNLLISILIEFENIITKIFEKIISKYPSAYLENSNISYTQVIKSKDLSEVKRNIIDKQVAVIMRENIFEWFRILEKNHRISISLENEYMKKFIEAYYRRNIVVHNDSKINSDYIKGVSRVYNKISDDMLGKKLRCSKKYIKEIINASLYVVIYLENQITELFKDENDDFIGSLMDFAYEKIKDEEFTLAREVCRLLKDRKIIKQEARIYSLINFWQTYKWDGKYEEVKKEVDEFDISAYEDVIKLAVYALRDEYEKIENILNREFNEEKQNKELAADIEEFPVFKNVRNQDFYKKFKASYPEVFVEKSAQINSDIEPKMELEKDKNGNFQIHLKIED